MKSLKYIVALLSISATAMAEPQNNQHIKLKAVKGFKSGAIDKYGPHVDTSVDNLYHKKQSTMYETVRDSIFGHTNT